MKTLFISQQSEGLLYKDPTDNPVIFGGAEVQLFFLSQRHPLGEYLFGIKTDRKKIPGVVVLSQRKTVWHSIISRPYSQIKALIQTNPDVMVYRLYEHILLVLYIYKLFSRTPLIYMVSHDSRLEKPVSLKEKLFTKIIIASDHVFVQNNTQLKQYKALSNKQNVSVLPNGFPFDSTPQKKETVLWVGRAEDWKNPELFLELASRYPEITFEMICTKGPDRAYFETLQKEAGVLSNLQFSSYVPFSDIQEYFEKAHLYVLTSEQEGFPNSLIQAGIAKTAVLSFNVNPNNMFEEPLGLCAYGKQDEFFAAADALLTSPDRRDSYGEHLHQYMKRNHDIHRVAQEFYSVLSSVVSRRDNKI